MSEREAIRRAKISEAFTPERKKQQAETARKLMSDPAIREKALLAQKTPEARQRNLEGQNRFWKDYLADPEARKKRGQQISEGNLRSWASKPDRRKKASQQMTEREAEKKRLIELGKSVLTSATKSKNKGGRPPTQTELFVAAKKIHEEEHLSYPEIARRLDPEGFKRDGPRAAGQRLCRGVSYLKKKML